MEGIVFQDGRFAYKVGRGKHTLRDEAEALQAVSRLSPLVPRFRRYDSAQRVLVREFVQGRVGQWYGSGPALRQAYEQLEPLFRQADFTAPEWKEDSFVIADNGRPVMVDLGFARPVGKRGVRRLYERLNGPLFPDDLFDLQFEVWALTREGDLAPQKGVSIFSTLDRIFGPKTVQPYRREYERAFL